MDAIIEQPYRHIVCAKSYMYVAVVFGTHCIAGKSLATSTAANIVTFTMYRYCVLFLSQGLSYHYFKSYVSWHQGSLLPWRSRWGVSQSSA